MQQPFPAGTPTLQTRQFEEQQKQNIFENQLNSAKFSLSASKGSGGSSSGGGGTLTERKNRELNQLTPGILSRLTDGQSEEQIISALVSQQDNFDYPLDINDITELVDNVYNVYIAGADEKRSPIDRKTNTYQSNALPSMETTTSRYLPTRPTIQRLEKRG